MPFVAPNTRVVKHIFLLRVRDSWAWSSTAGFTGWQTCAEITAISDCNVANGRQSKAECIDRCRDEDTFLRDIKINSQFGVPRERREMPRMLLCGNDSNPRKGNSRARLFLNYFTNIRKVRANSIDYLLHLPQRHVARNAVAWTSIPDHEMIYFPEILARVIYI